jgi:hypothetical protein
MVSSVVVCNFSKVVLSFILDSTFRMFFALRSSLEAEATLISEALAKDIAKVSAKKGLSLV